MSFWNSSDSWQLEAKLTGATDINDIEAAIADDADMDETEDMDMTM